jgi:hypothetical protein
VTNALIFGRPAKVTIVAFALLAAPMADLALGLEMRAGWEPHIRINGVVGLQLGR